jgi:intracellular multiplication protein IcmE
MELMMSNRPSVLSNIRGTVKDRGSRRIVMVVVAAVVLMVTFSVVMFQGSGAQTASRTPTLPQVPSAPGGPAENENYVKITEKVNQENADRARASGASSVATLTGVPRPTDAFAPPPAAKPPVVVPPVVPVQQPAAQGAQAAQPAPGRDEALMQAMQAQMRTLFTAWTPVKAHIVTADLPPAGQRATDSAADQAAKSAAAQAAKGVTFMPAGKISYARTITAVSSDQPGSPVLVEILDGPAKGGRAIGKFERQDERLVVTFNKLSLPSGRTATIDAIAVSPDTAEASIASDVDHHIVTRFVLPIAASFIEGYGQSIARAGQTVVNSPFGGATTTYGALSGRQEIFTAAGTAGKTAAGIITQAAPKGPTVSLSQGVAIGILFLSEVTEPAS